MDLDAVFEELPSSFDLGSLDRVVAWRTSGDRLAYTGCTGDYIGSRLSCERFREPADRESVLARWKADQERLVAELNGHDNFSYFIAHHRPLNDSPCCTLITTRSRGGAAVAAAPVLADAHVAALARRRERVRRDDGVLHQQRAVGAEHHQRDKGRERREGETTGGFVSGAERASPRAPRGAQSS
ncbi:hypothetical protein [Sorangium sp. So ce1099]|uniref:hypothetical protein n=1 Tax=Sorangium sp. So ce1099 TaxID=3133331 RepID=UPI003F5D5614